MLIPPHIKKSAIDLLNKKKSLTPVAEPVRPKVEVSAPFRKVVSSDDVRSVRLGKKVLSSPVPLGNDRFLVPADGEVYLFQGEDLKKEWTIGGEMNPYISVLGSSAALTTRDDKIYLLDLDTYSMKRFVISGPLTSPALTMNGLIIGNDYRVAFLKSKRIAFYSLGDRIFKYPFRIDDRVLILDIANNIYIMDTQTEELVAVGRLKDRVILGPLPFGDNAILVSRSKIHVIHPTSRHGKPSITSHALFGSSVSVNLTPLTSNHLLLIARGGYGSVVYFLEYSDDRLSFVDPEGKYVQAFFSPEPGCVYPSGKTPKAIVISREGDIYTMSPKEGISKIGRLDMELTSSEGYLTPVLLSDGRMVVSARGVGRLWFIPLRSE